MSIITHKLRAQNLSSKITKVIIHTKAIMTQKHKDKIIA